MTPFALFLYSLRKSKSLQQSQLTDLLEVNPCYISAIEKSKKGPPSKPILEKLIDRLELDKEEQGLLWDSIEKSQRVIRIPESASLEEYAFASELRKQLGALSKDQIEAMRSILKLGESSKAKRKLEIRRI
ncbi:MAG: helix-turn-helix domain-containing protein [Kangiellaceae bacterium]|nr:helix-turn-helix domain-containing protein [Kangiellaceae bacterium]MCW8997158.1 helix-turn-helix domain-containing protein [Kangiellaceae bacterium]MCW9016308.1 helix-turn-helix domain-containing protein [Kangiellaceae bacterium]